MAIKILAKSSFFFRKLKRLKPFWRKKGKKKVSLRNPRWLVSQHFLVPVCFFMTSLNVSLSHHGWWCYNDHQFVFCCLFILSALTGLPGHFCSVSKKIFGCNFFFIWEGKMSTQGLSLIFTLLFICFFRESFCICDGTTWTKVGWEIFPEEMHFLKVKTAPSHCLPYPLDKLCCSFANMDIFHGCLNLVYILVQALFLILSVLSAHYLWTKWKKHTKKVMLIVIVIEYQSI